MAGLSILVFFHVSYGVGVVVCMYLGDLSGSLRRRWVWRWAGNWELDSEYWRWWMVESGWNFMGKAFGNTGVLVVFITVWDGVSDGGLVSFGVGGKGRLEVVTTGVGGVTCGVWGCLRFPGVEEAIQVFGVGSLHNSVLSC